MSGTSKTTLNVQSGRAGPDRHSRYFHVPLPRSESSSEPHEIPNRPPQLDGADAWRLALIVTLTATIIFSIAAIIMSLQGLMSGADCAVQSNPLSQVLKHAEGDRSLQQVCGTLTPECPPVCSFTSRTELLVLHLQGCVFIVYC